MSDTRLKYTKPELFDLQEGEISVAAAQSQCHNGTSYAGICQMGTKAGTACRNGGTASLGCRSGDDAGFLLCRTGTNVHL
jgi:hypothetical protein